jgi:putative DNA methylase
VKYRSCELYAEGSTTSYRKKLIEVALPLDVINREASHEKSIRHGHPSTLHLWWARKPLAAARAVLFAQIVDDPSAWPELFPGEEEQRRERQRLFSIIKKLVRWKNSNDETVLTEAREEIWRSWRRACAGRNDREFYNPDVLPEVHDPFAGGGSIPLEAQRLGLRACAGDINPVAVLINKALIEIPARLSGLGPVNPAPNRRIASGGAEGLAEDVLFYGNELLREAERRIGHLYPKVRITEEMVSERDDLRGLVGKELPVIAWLWARTVKSPNPAFSDVDVPLIASYILSKRRRAYLEPVIDGMEYRFRVRIGDLPSWASRGTKSGGSRSSFLCLLSGTPIPFEYIRNEGRARRMGARLIAIVADGPRGRIYLPATEEHQDIARRAEPKWKPEVILPNNKRNFNTPLYGLATFGDLFSPRQLVALTTISDLITEMIERVHRDALAAGIPAGEPLARGSGARAYAEGVGVYLALALDKCADYLSTICSWHSGRDNIRNTFARQAIPMAWDYVEANPFSGSTGSFSSMLQNVVDVLRGARSGPECFSVMEDARSQSSSRNRIVSTDPPYHDNIGYADLSDYFYVWLRRSLKEIYPELFATVSTPKGEEMVVAPYRHSSREDAERFFLEGMSESLRRIAEQAHPEFPVTVYYAYKQSENMGNGRTGWETFLEAVIRAGFMITGTWPMRTELGNRTNAREANVLASSIVLVCRPRNADAGVATRRELIAALREELPEALRIIREGGIAPVDLQQAAIGPGMAVFSRYSQVVESSGERVSVGEALKLINATLDEVLAEQEGDFDADTRWAVAWFEQHGFDPGEFGDAETLSKAKNTSVTGMVEAGIIESKRGRVRLLRPEELPSDYDPAMDKRLTVWEMTHHLIRLLESGGEGAAAKFLSRLPRMDSARDLAYRLYMICDRSRRSQDAIRYNALVQSWPEMVSLIRSPQTTLG